MLKCGWDQNRLKMNNEKTEFIVFASHQLMPKCETKTLCVNGVNVERAEVIKYLGVWMGPTHDIQKTYLYEEPYCNAEFPKNQAYLLITHLGSSTYTSVRSGHIPSRLL